MHLLQHLVDVDGIAFLPLPLALLVAGANSLCLAGLLGALGADFGRHDDGVDACLETEQLKIRRKVDPLLCSPAVLAATRVLRPLIG